MNVRKTGKLAALIVSMGLAGCATTGPYPQAYAPYHGNEVAGAVIGGTAGGLLGHQVGQGQGRTAATIGGAILGAGVGASVGRSADYANRGYAPRDYYSGSRYPDYPYRTRRYSDPYDY